jgi:serine/threonine-protein kinase
MQLAENLVVGGKFRLNRLLGRGGMGSVWHATHLALDIPCAVKFIEGDFAQVPEMQMRFQREAKAAAALRSPHVVQILDHDIWEGMPFIAMELLDGEELSKRISRVGKLTGAELNGVIAQVCRALTKAHGQGIIHRDLKPDNIFLVRDDDREIAKVLDFGIAKSKNPNLDIGSNTKTGAMLGTPYYMSPEQAQGNKAIDTRSDLWALGVIAYECLTGERPFESDALGDLLMQIMVKPLPKPSEKNPALGPAVDAWFAKACERDPANRFATAKELSDALAQALGTGVSTDIMAPAEVRAVMKSGLGGTVPLAQTPVPSDLVATAAAPAAPKGPEVASTTAFAGEPPEGLPKKSSTGLFVGLAVAAVVVLGVGVGIAMKAKGSSAAGEGTATVATSVATTPPTPTTTSTTTPSATTVASVATDPGTSVGAGSAPSVAAAPSTTAAPPTTHAATGTHAIGGAKPSASIATKPPVPSATATGKKPGDLGF